MIDQMPPLSNDAIVRYARQIVLDKVGLDGQRKLSRASVLLIGTGGLGSPVALYLAAAGVGRIGIVDFDVVEASNLHRQVLHATRTIGERKVVSARQRMLDLNPSIHVDALDEPFVASNAMRLAEPYDIIIDGSDNLPTRYLSNDLCVLTGKPNIYGAVSGFQGQASVFDARSGPCYRCLFPVPPPPEMVPTCAQSGILGVLPGVIGTVQATEALKLILGVGKPLVGVLLMYDAVEQRMDHVTVAKAPGCAVCGAHPTITELIDYDVFCGVPGRTAQVADDLAPEWEISPRRLKECLDRGDRILLLDVREPGEWAIASIEGARRIPLRELKGRLTDLPRDQMIVLICRTGVRSARALSMLRQDGFEAVRNLKGGLHAWANDVDPSLPLY